MRIDLILGTIGLGLAVSTALVNAMARRSIQRVIFSLNWCVFVYWMVFLAPHIRNDIFAGTFSLITSGWFLFNALSPNYSYPIRQRLRHWFFGKQFATRIDLANERMTRRRDEAARRNISVYELMKEEQGQNHH